MSLFYFSFGLKGQLLSGTGVENTDWTPRRGTWERYRKGQQWLTEDSQRLLAVFRVLERNIVMTSNYTRAMKSHWHCFFAQLGRVYIYFFKWFVVFLLTVASLTVHCIKHWFKSIFLSFFLFSWKCHDRLQTEQCCFILPPILLFFTRQSQWLQKTRRASCFPQHNMM